jgi:hypothetical protein
MMPDDHAVVCFERVRHTSILTDPVANVRLAYRKVATFAAFIPIDILVTAGHYPSSADGACPLPFRALYLPNSLMASSAKTPPVIVIGTNGAVVATSLLEIMI